MLMDLRLPDKSGVEAIQSIRAMSPRARIVVVTTYEANNFSALYGFSSGGVVSMVTRSGTNQIHGGLSNSGAIRI